MGTVTINHSNAEDLLFMDSNLMKKLDRNDLYHQWKMGRLNPSLRQIGRKAVIDLLNTLSNNEISIISQHLSKEVSIEKIDYTIVKYLDTNIFEASDTLNKEEVFGELFLHRSKDQLYIGLWK